MKPYHFTLDPAAESVIHPPRSVPVHLIVLYRKEPDDMLNLGVLAPVDRPTDWVNSIVLSEIKNDKGEVTKLRVRLDPRDLNKWAKKVINSSPSSTQRRGAGTYHSKKRAPTSQPSASHSADIASNVFHLALLFHKTCFKSSST